MTRNKRLKQLVFLAALLALLFLLSAGLAGAGPLATTIDRWTTAGGGGTISNSGISIDSTIGQPIAGLATGGNSQICTGFHCAVKAELAPTYYLYLPNVVRK